MDRLDRMELADIGHPRKMAEAVLKQIPGITFPIPIADIALALDIRAIEDFETAEFEGALLTNESKSNAAILVRRGVREQRRRFTIGHELGHYLMPLHFPPSDGFRCTKDDMRKQEHLGLGGRPQWEAQANVFASEILMPSVEFRKRTKSKGGLAIESLIALSDEFGVSKLACGRKLLQLAEDPAALVLAKDGLVKQLYRSRDFPFLSLKIGLRLPRASIALGQKHAPEEITEIESTDQTHWLSRDDQKGLELFEQTLFQQDGWTLTLLCAEIKDEDDDG